MIVGAQKQDINNPYVPFNDEDEKDKCCSSKNKNQQSNQTACSKQQNVNNQQQQTTNTCSKEKKGKKGGCCGSKKEKQCGENQKQEQKVDTCGGNVKLQIKDGEKGQQISEEEFRKWVTIALILSIFTIVQNMTEGIVSLFFGIEDKTIALKIFGSDSFLEVISGFVVFWRFRQDFASTLNPQENKQNNVSVLDVHNEENIKKERITTRIIGVCLFLLGVCAIGGATINLINKKGPDSSLPGLIISACTISFMFFIYNIKLKSAKKLNNNKTLLADAKCSLSCIVLSLVLFLGSLTTILTEKYLDKDSYNGWWLDSVITILMAILIMKEGFDGFLHSFSKNFTGGGCCAA